MKAVRIHAYGSPDVIVVDDVARPEPAPDELLVRVAAAGVGPWDAWVRAGKSVVPHQLPLTLGSDVSGQVVSLGADVRGFELGQEVFGATNPSFEGGYAEYAAVKAAMAAAKPRLVSHVEAAAAPVVAVTAWQMLFDHAQVHAGQRMLILGAAGSVGASAVQLAVRAGAEVIGLEGHGADLEPGMEPVDAVIDTVGEPLQRRALLAVKRGGVLISAVSRPDAHEAERRGVRAAFMLVDVGTATLAEIAALMDDAKLTVRVGAVLPLVEARTAHEMLAGQRPRPRGKIVLAADAAA